MKLDDKWYLIDATWDDPTAGGQRCARRTLFTPPALFLFDHFPDEPNWQLVPTPMTPGEFVRQPMMSPDIGRFGLTLLDPTRAQVSVDGEITITLDNPEHAGVVATAASRRLEAARAKQCTVASLDRRTSVHCKLGEGAYEIQLFANTASEGMFDYVGSLLANSR